MCLSICFKIETLNATLCCPHQHINGLGLVQPLLDKSASLVYQCGSDEMEHMNNETNVLGQLLTPGSLTPNAAFLWNWSGSLLNFNTLEALHFEFPFFTTGQCQKRCGEEVLDHNWSGRHVGDFFVLLHIQTVLFLKYKTRMMVRPKSN